MKLSILTMAAALVMTQTATAGMVHYAAALSGPAEAPPNASPGTGSALVTYDDVALTMRVQAQFSGLTGNVTASHIHCCTAVPGVANVGVATPTPTFPGFPSGVTSGTYDSTFDMTLTSSFNNTFRTNNGGTAATALAALLAGMDTGRSYFNIHTSAFPGGEIRGFLQPVPEPSTMLLGGVALAALAFVRRRRA